MKPHFGIAPLFLALVFAGCGGTDDVDSPAASRSKASLKVIWPVREGRAIPQAANSIRITLSSGVTPLKTTLVARPAVGNETETEFSDLPVGTLNISVNAYPNADGTGVAQAVGTGTMTTSMDTPGVATISLASTAVSLSISPATIRVGKGTTTPLSLNALDGAGNIVLLTAGGGTESIAWSTDNGSIATVTGTGPTATLNGLASGSVNVKAKLTINDAGDVVTGTKPGTIVAASGTVTVK